VQRFSKNLGGHFRSLGGEQNDAKKKFHTENTTNISSHRTNLVTQSTWRQGFVYPWQRKC